MNLRKQAVSVDYFVSQGIPDVTKPENTIFHDYAEGHDYISFLPKAFNKIKISGPHSFDSYDTDYIGKSFKVINIFTVIQDENKLTFFGLALEGPWKDKFIFYSKYLLK